MQHLKNTSLPAAPQFICFLVGFSPSQSFVVPNGQILEKTDYTLISGNPYIKKTGTQSLSANNTENDTVDVTWHMCFL